MLVQTFVFFAAALPSGILFGLLIKLVHENHGVMRLKMLDLGHSKLAAANP